MARSLLLMRHAKSDWNDGRLTDKERPLNQRGRASAPIMATWVVANQLLPDMIICSSAVRTQQTLELMMQNWISLRRTNSKIELPEIHIEESLYLAPDSLILSLASSVSNVGAKQCIMMLGHNPGMEVLASKMSECEIAMPTSAIAVLDSNSLEEAWPADWTSSKMWKWRGLVKPRDIGTETI